MLFDRRIAETIKQAWIAAGRSRNQPEMVDAVPDLTDLLALLETTFLASIEREEGVPTS